VSVRAFGQVHPSIHGEAFVADNATLIGAVTVGAHASIWFNAVLRGDVEAIEIGEGTNIQDGAILHTDPGAPLRVGRDVTVGHGAVLHGCEVRDGSLVGIRAVVLDHAVIGRDCLIGSNALVTPRQQIPDGSLVLGSPAKVVRRLTEAEIEELRFAAGHYVRSGSVYLRAAAASRP
jgi:carbonic anhydrase/acetyltransferase-like protein (isoleucine patch superfamily)